MSTPTYQCAYHEADGKRCPEAAFYRLFLSRDDPFNVVDVCIAHRYKYNPIKIYVFDVIGEIP